MDGLEKRSLPKDALTNPRPISKNFPWLVVMDDSLTQEDNDVARFKCPQRTETPDLPQLTSSIRSHKRPPLESYVDENAKPFTCHIPMVVPAHWEKQVKIDGDVALGVLEKVLQNTLVMQRHRMVLTRKHNGDLRHTVNLQPLKDTCKRQTHCIASTLQQVMTMPHNNLKTTSDVWKGFYPVRIKPEEKHYTTFIMPYDKIIEDMKNYRRAIDDALPHMTGRNGIIMSIEKFNFVQNVMDWAGVRINKDSVEPPPELVESIQDYPTPTNIMAVRSSFALVEQAAPFYVVKPHLLPFWESLKKNQKFYRDENLEKYFT